MGIVRKVASIGQGGLGLPNQDNSRKLQSEFASSRSFGGIVVWRISQYVQDQGVGYDVTSADFTGSEDNYLMGIVQGTMVDYDFAQYQFKKYSIRVYADKEINFPIVINWNKPMSISVTYDGTETEVYTTDGEDNVSMNFNIPLEVGTSDISIFVYTDEAGVSLKSAIDQSVVGQIMTESGGGGSLPVISENQIYRGNASNQPEATNSIEVFDGDGARITDDHTVGLDERIPNLIYNIGSLPDHTTYKKGTLLANFSGYAVDWTERQPDGASNYYWFLIASSSDGVHLLAGVENGKLWLSHDSGASWTEQQPSGAYNRVWSCGCISDDGQIIIAGYSSGRLYLTINGGSSWAETQPAGNVNRVWKSADCISDGSVIVVCSSGYAYRSINAGTSWTTISVEATGQYFSIACDSTGSKIILADNGGRIWTTTNGGTNWTERRPIDDNNYDWFIVNISSDGLIMTASVDSGRFYFSDNGGVSWTDKYPVDQNYGRWSEEISSDGSKILISVYDLSDSYLYYSVDFGDTWVLLNQPPAGTNDWGLALDSTGVTLLAGGYSGRLYTGIISLADGVLYINLFGWQSLSI